MILWYPLVGCKSYCLTILASGLQWYVGDGSHLKGNMITVDPEQARWVKTVKVRTEVAKP